MKQYNITGMSCAACQARVEKAVSAVPGVTACSVSLLTNSMGVEGTATPEAVVAAVEGAGYGASLQSTPRGTSANGVAGERDALADRETPILLQRLIWSLGFLALLMYVSMGHIMWGWPLPSVLAKNPLAIGLLQLLLTVAVMVINQRFFIRGFKGLIHLAPNMDTLVALGSSAAFGYSTYVLFAMTYAQLAGDTEAAAHGLHELYFESAAMILALITVGKMLEARSKGKTTNALRSLMRLAPATATVLRDGAEVTVPVAEVRRGDRFAVRPGERIPVDGTVLEGHSAINEAALTGESIPVDKAPGDEVSAATVNRSGHLVCEATRVGEDTTLAQIIRMVSDAAATKAPIARIADKVSGVFVPIVMAIALITVGAWLLAGETVGFAIARGISVLVISCPCALGLATPVAIMVGNGVGAKNGILFKTAVSLEGAGRVSTVVLDKTGTVTRGEPRVTDLLPARGMDAETVMQRIYSLESKSEHPLSAAIVARGKQMGLSAGTVTDFEALPGRGVKGVVDGRMVYGGSRTLIETCAPIPADVLQRADSWAEAGKTPLFFAMDGAFLGAVAVADVIKEDSADAVRELRDMGLRVVMLTGDDRRTAAAIGAQAGVDEVIAEVLPNGKEAVIRELQQNGRVAMVGDGINDAPALTRADVGIAIGAGADVAIDAADVVLVKSRLSDVPAAIRLSRATLRNIRQNLFWAFVYNIIGIPLAAGVWIPVFGWELNPMFGAAAMSLSSFCVVSNALRLNLFNIRDPKAFRRKVKMHPEATSAGAASAGAASAGAASAGAASAGAASAGATSASAARDTQAIQHEGEEQTMKKIMKIEGMMCPRCEAHVKKALEALDGVVSATADHDAGTAVVVLGGAVSDDALRTAVEADGYQVISIE